MIDLFVKLKLYISKNLMIRKKYNQLERYFVNNINFLKNEFARTTRLVLKLILNARKLTTINRLTM
jgi:hypothetical protein